MQKVENFCKSKIRRSAFSVIDVYEVLVYLLNLQVTSFLCPKLCSQAAIFQRNQPWDTSAMGLFKNTAQMIYKYKKRKYRQDSNPPPLVYSSCALPLRHSHCPKLFRLDSRPEPIQRRRFFRLSTRPNCAGKRRSSPPTSARRSISAAGRRTSTAWTRRRRRWTRSTSATTKILRLEELRSGESSSVSCLMPSESKWLWIDKYQWIMDRAIMDDG